MSIRDRAKIEMKIAGITGNDAEAVSNILDIFFDNWDSGGAVAVMAPVLQRLIAGKPLGPLTGGDEEWVDVSEHSTSAYAMFQNRRCSTVFKENGVAYDIDVRGRPPIVFPYYPEEASVRPPVYAVGDDGESAVEKK